MLLHPQHYFCCRKPNNRISKIYLLPDYTTTDRGRVLTDEEVKQRQAERKKSQDDSEQDNINLDEQVRLLSARRASLMVLFNNYAYNQVLVMNNERIAVPEILFHPSDIGIPQVHCSAWHPLDL